jgi:hypothetical protein
MTVVFISGDTINELKYQPANNLLVWRVKVFQGADKGILCIGIPSWLSMGIEISSHANGLETNRNRDAFPTGESGKPGRLQGAPMGARSAAR